MRLVFRIIQVIKNIKKIFIKKHLLRTKRYYLFVSYLIIEIRRFFDGRKFNFFNKNKVKICDYVVEHNNFLDFYWTFLEIFINEDYYFATNNEKPTIVDCGGNIGMSVLYFKLIYPSANIIVFEPEEVNYKILINNINNNDLDDVIAHNVAVSNRSEVVELYGDKRASTIFKELINKFDEDNDQKSVIQVKPISDYLDQTNIIDFIKIDIEGAEGLVMKDLDENKILPNIQYLVMEYHMFYYKENMLSDIIKIIENNNFFFKFDDSNDINKLNKNKYYRFMLLLKNNNFIS